MSLNKLFYSFASLLLLAAAFIFLCRVFITPELIYPMRIDSLYVRYEVNRVKGNTSSVLFNPASLGLKYKNFDVKTTDNLTLRGWYVTCDDSEANTILIIHDLSQSK